jgi:putative GTP pyrophosphokinase
LDIEALRKSYQIEAPRADRLRKSVVEQLDELFKQKEISLGVPMESRVKTLASFEEKLERKKLLDIESVAELHDLIGVRTILLFRQDLEKVGTALREIFEVVSVEDAGARLSDVQFGYQSQHYVVGLRADWLKIPTFRGLDGLNVEIQVRTLAQHIWAAASHKLQYKQEQSVPPPLRRTIHRVSALLETVDLELERVLNERKTYITDVTDSPKPSETLNVDLVEAILKELFPLENIDVEEEEYAELLEELFLLQITTASQLRELIKKNHKEVEAKEKELLEDSMNDDHAGTSPDRTARGVYFTHVGLARTALSIGTKGEYEKIMHDLMQKRWKEFKERRKAKAKARRAMRKKQSQ